MKILVTGGTGVIGEGVIPALLRAGHEVRLLSRGAEKDSRQWPEGVEAFAGDVSDPGSITGAGDGCDAVIHISGIIQESPPDITFESVNVQGTMNMIAEAERAGVAKLIFMSSLVADRGSSAYHESKRRAEELVRDFDGDWLILRPGNVYGPGDDVLSRLLKMVRALPVIPIIDAGDQQFQPLWYDDLGDAVALALETQELRGQVLELAGTEITTTNDLLDRLYEITGRTPARVPVPSFLASLGSRIADITSLGEQFTKLTGVDIPINEAKLTMLVEENYIEPSKTNALTEVFHITPVSLDEGLRRLADQLPEQLPSDGVGPLEQKLFWADIENSALSPEEMIELFRQRVSDVMPIEFDAEPGTPRVIEKGIILTASLPMRGNIQMCVEEVTDNHITFSTVEGHPLAGIVRFNAVGVDDPLNGVRFLIEIYTRPSNLFDRIAMAAIGSVLQRENWEQVVERMVELSRGSAPNGVESEAATLDDETTTQIERWVEEMIINRKAQANAAKVAGSNLNAE